MHITYNESQSVVADTAAHRDMKFTASHSWLYVEGLGFNLNPKPLVACSVLNRLSVYPFVDHKTFNF